jgi:hypothetical protein
MLLQTLVANNLAKQLKASNESKNLNSTENSNGDHRGKRALGNNRQVTGGKLVSTEYAAKCESIERTLR